MARTRLSKLEGIGLGETLDEIQEMVGKRVELMVNMGTRRTGTLTDVIVNTITVNGDSMPVPIGIELNGDASDEISFLEVTSILTLEEDED